MLIHRLRPTKATLILLQFIQHIHMLLQLQITSIPYFQMLVIIQPRATPTHTAAMITYSFFTFCTYTFSSQREVTTLSTFCFIPSYSCCETKIRSTEPCPPSHELKWIAFFDQAGCCSALRTYAAYYTSNMMLHVVGSPRIMVEDLHEIHQRN